MADNNGSIRKYFVAKKKLVSAKPQITPSLPNDPGIESFFECACESFIISSNNGALPTTPYDPHTIHTWVFPGTKEFRKYQFRICRTAIFYNTLICLPTGLGKTFIATVVMHNYYRWFIRGLVFFLAPTKPLVDQQFEAFSEIVVNVDPKHIAQLTGKQSKSLRKKQYGSARIFFMTPQTLANDLESGLIKEKDVACVIFDEAHKATGNYAYCRIVKHLEISNVGYRVVALSATPGSDEDSIQQLITNLCIAKIEARDETDLDVKQYTFDRNVQIVNIRKSSEVERLEKLVVEVAEIPKRFLEDHHLLPKTVQKLQNKMLILEWQERFKQRASRIKDKHGEDFSFLAFTSFSCLLSLVNGHNMLLTHGIETFKAFCEKFVESAEKKRARKILIQSEAFKALSEYLKELEAPEIHPKLAKTKEILHEYFRGGQEKVSQAIIFTLFVDSAKQICNYFKNDQTVSASLFIGQANGYTQKQQMSIITKFKEHKFNTLVATCIGEEGLDIGHVNLIICYDCTCSPVRMIQRFGRTGRKQNGKVVILLSEEEERKFCIAKKRGQEIYKILRAYSDSVKIGNDKTRKARNKTKGYKFIFYDFNPRMVKDGVFPKPVYLHEGKREITVEEIQKENKVEILNKFEYTKSNSRKNDAMQRPAIKDEGKEIFEGLLKVMDNPVPLLQEEKIGNCDEITNLNEDDLATLFSDLSATNDTITTTAMKRKSSAFQTPINNKRFKIK